MVGDYIVLAKIIVANEQSQHVDVASSKFREKTADHSLPLSLFLSLSQSVCQVVACCQFIGSTWVLCTCFCKLNDCSLTKHGFIDQGYY